MRKNNYQKGQEGEEIAQKYLQKNHYHVLTTNFKAQGGEVDIIAISPQKQLVAVEVKSFYIQGDEWAEQITMEKKSKIEKTIKVFAHQHKMFKYPICLEIIAVFLPEKKVQHFQEEFFDL